MPRSPSTYSLPPGSTPIEPNTVISSSIEQAFREDVAQTFNTVQPIVYGGTGSNDLKLTDTDFGIKDNSDPTKIGQFNASGLPTSTTRTYDLPYYSGTLGLVSDIRGQIYGLTLSNNVTNPTNDIDIAAGSAVDSTGTRSMLLASSLTKRLDATFVAGTNQGGRFYTTLAATGWSWLFEICNPTTGAVDVGFSDNATNPTAGASYPAGFTLYRYIGAIYRDAGVNAQFTQNGNQFLWSFSRDNINQPAPGIVAFLSTLTVPPGRKVDVLFSALVRGGAAPTNCLFTSPDQTDMTPTGTSNYSVVGPPSVSGVLAGGQFTTRTNTSAQIRTRLDFSDANVFVRIATNGYIDTRDQY